MNRTEQALERLKGCAVESINHHDSIGVVEIHFEGGSLLSVQALDRRDICVMIIAPKEDTPC